VQGIGEDTRRDQKLVLAAYGTSLMTKVGLTELGIGEPGDDGPVLTREERIQQVTGA
jgi:hypothetical protein